MMNKIKIIYDMETQDPDDFFTASFLSGHPKVNLMSITIVPGSRKQVGLSRSLS